MRAVAVKSCGGAEGCHITATLDDGGILNYEIDQKNKNNGFVCTKCHLVYGKQAVPASHVNAIRSRESSEMKLFVSLMFILFLCLW